MRSQLIPGTIAVVAVLFTLPVFAQQQASAVQLVVKFAPLDFPGNRALALAIPARERKLAREKPKLEAKQAAPKLTATGLLAGLELMRQQTRLALMKHVQAEREGLIGSNAELILAIGKLTQEQRDGLLSQAKAYTRTEEAKSWGSNYLKPDDLQRAISDLQQIATQTAAQKGSAGGAK